MITPLLKPSRYERLERKDRMRRLKDLQKRVAARREQALNYAIRLEVFTRDKGKCRACGRALKMFSESALEMAEAHHVIYRSAGGSDGPENRVSLCRKCHDDEHRHVLMISGDPIRGLTFKREWEG